MEEPRSLTYLLTEYSLRPGTPGRRILGRPRHARRAAVRSAGRRKVPCRGEARQRGEHPLRRLVAAGAVGEEGGHERSPAGDVQKTKNYRE